MPVLSLDQLVLRLNEVYHDLENQAYDHKHPDISEDEVPRWHRFGSELLADPRPAWNILDVGTGTGFVPRQLKEWLRPEDRFTCSDLSGAMLEECRRNLEQSGLACRIDLLKLDGKSIDLPDHSQDAVTINAVMHHLAKPEEMCAEIDRVLRPGGCVVIGHEPNRAHHARRLLVWNYWLVLPFADWKLFSYEVILRLGLFEALRKPLGRLVPELRRQNELVDIVNARLLAAGDIRKPLGAAEMSSLLDTNSPTAGGMHGERGFTREDFLAFLPGYGIVRCETYKHLNKIHPRRDWVKRYQDWLGKKFPEHGSSLFCSLRKPG